MIQEEFKDISQVLSFLYTQNQILNFQTKFSKGTKNCESLFKQEEFEDTRHVLSFLYSQNKILNFQTKFLGAFNNYVTQGREGPS